MGHGKFFVPRRRDPMRVDPRILQSVGFIGEVAHKDENGIHGDLHATGFFAFVPSARFPGLKFAYFVTAKHVATDLKDRNIFILVNSKHGGITYLTNVYPQWWLHPTDATADL